MHRAIFLLSILIHRFAAAQDIPSLPFKLGIHTFGQQIEQEYQLHVCTRLKKLTRQYPNHVVVGFYKQLKETSLNQLTQQQKIFNKAQPVYALIQACPSVAQHFNQASTQPKYKDPSQVWEQFKKTAYVHLKKFRQAELPQFDPSIHTDLTQADQEAYKAWLIIYFAIKQNQFLR